MTSKKTSVKKKGDPLKWWREARFGLFIHWGLYAVPAGTWKGKKIPNIGEWIMLTAKIPNPEYEALAKEFNPVKFDADKVVRMAKDAGMKYVVITAKHHDGFAMYDSPSNDYNIVSRTPYGKDPMKALAKACKKYGLKFCFYYSQSQDWHDPDGINNFWYFDETKKTFTDYLKRKCAPQVKEILTQYGPIGLIWFDTPCAIPKRHSVMLSRLVHGLQPKCLVSGRVGSGVGDYGSLGDNQIPAGRLTGEWETPATMNDTWGFKSYDHNWKSVKTLLCLLTDLASKGVNYLLNIGPTADGVIPKPSVDRLAAIGKWMKVNSEAIYATQANPYPYELEWGRITQKPGKLYLLVYNWRRKLTLLGLRNKVKKVTLLADRKKKLAFTQESDRTLDLHRLDLSLPAKKPDKYVSVVVVEIAGNADVDEMVLQQSNGSVELAAHMARIHAPKTGRKAVVDVGGRVCGWSSKSNWLSWEFKVSEPGEFEVKIVVPLPSDKWKGGHRVKASVGRQAARGVIRPEEEIDSPRTKHGREVAATLGTISIGRAGTHKLTLKAETIKKSAGHLGVSAVQLAPVG